MRSTPVERRISGMRRILRQGATRFARGHTGCQTGRGCNCFSDRAIAVLEKAEQDLFSLQLESIATPRERP